MIVYSIEFVVRRDYKVNQRTSYLSNGRVAYSLSLLKRVQTPEDEGLKMYITRIRLKNWRNFRSVDVRLSQRTYLVGPNASGKSNFLDAIRFLRDLSIPEGSLKMAITDRHGVSKVRCLAARTEPEIEIEVDISDSVNRKPTWTYMVAIMQERSGHRNTYIKREKVWEGRKVIVERPDTNDEKDPLRKTQTYLEQINANQKFRPIAEMFSGIRYMHLVPQLLRHAGQYSGSESSADSQRYDPFGLDFLERLSKTPKRIKEFRLKRIEKALNFAVPFFQDLTEVRDKLGRPHLEAKYTHWRMRGAKQWEDQFSDGTLRLIGLLWSLMEGDSPVLLEEPELSLNHSIIRKIPGIIKNINKGRKNANRQVILSTHSLDLLDSNEIGLEEILILKPSQEGTVIEQACAHDEIRALVEEGMTPGQAIMPYTEPDNIDELNTVYSR